MVILMIYPVLDNIIIIMLTVTGLINSKYPELFIIAAGLLMIITTYKSFHEEKDKILSAIEIFLMVSYSLLSGRIWGFLIFFLLKEAKVYIRLIMGISMHIIAILAVYQNKSVAICILDLILLIIAFLALIFIYSMIDFAEKRKINDNDRITASNISELHEKRLNQQLIIQNFVVEENARLIERENISRNIHNSAGHSITAAIMTLDAADMLYDIKPDEARKKMNDANKRIRESLESIRRAVRILDEDNVELAAGDLKSELDMIINEFMMDTGIMVNRNYSGLMDIIKIPYNHAVFLTGFLKEMLTNGVKHGNANEFVVILLGDSAHVRLEISDNGHSDFDMFNSKQRIENGFGIKKIISYAEKCGGKTTIENDNGFRMMVELPIVFGE